MNPAPHRLQTSAAAIEPALWRRPAWLSAPLLTALWLALVVYGSLLPWGLDVAGFVADAGGPLPALGAWLSSPRWLPATAEASSLGVPTWVSDLLLNLVLYGPLGVLLRLSLARVTARRGVQIAAGVAAVVLISWLIESTQSLIPGRYASVQDVLANGLGGAVGVLLGRVCSSLWRAAAFAVFVWLSGPIGLMQRQLLTPRRRALLMLAVLLLNTLLFAGWYLSTRGASGGGGFWLVPFQLQFRRSYDVAALMLGRSLIVYCLACTVLLLTMMGGRTRLALSWVVLVVALMAAAVEGLKLVRGGASADITEPLLALIAGGFVLTLAFMVVDACRLSCRRKQQQPVAVDRRRRSHDYRFGLGGR